MLKDNQEIIKMVSVASSKLLKEKGYVSVVDVLMEMGKLSTEDYEAWRLEKVSYLEKVIRVDFPKINLILKTIKNHSKTAKMRASKTVYKSWGKGRTVLLRFSRAGDPSFEEAYSTHFLMPEKSKKNATNNKVAKKESEKNATNNKVVKKAINPQSPEQDIKK
ncbi:hypothetical protein [Candidatus Parabeggiatoa sp. HSG14]|uniref:hypothetical protein n=1 Tax=Candidatus Parabeggiatoa sp. HSG14 TaxID=3055593 RepID=UPI0025A6E4E9|nr:hypothetical protein [Thiotrichales bacterium HSG14]